MMEWLIMFVTLLVVLWGWRNPRYLVPMLIVAFPLEISRTWYPDLFSLVNINSLEGVINAGRIVTLTLLARYIVGGIAERQFSWVSSFARVLVGHRTNSFRTPSRYGALFIVFGLYILWGLISAIWAVDLMKPMGGVARLSILWLLAVAVYDNIRRNDSFWLVPISFSMMASFLSILGIYEMVTKHFVWMQEIYLPLNRINATFVDANIYARFLIIGVLATLILILYQSTTSWKFAGLVVLAVQLAAILFTGSRSGWIAVALGLMVMTLLIPRKTTVFILFGTFTAAGLSIMFRPELLRRVSELIVGFWAASTQRQYLMASGWDMFKNNPVLGVGLGGFQEMMLTKYAQVIQHGVSLSHTALITTAAELGIVGLLLTGVILLVLIYEYFSLRNLIIRVRNQVGNSEIVLQASFILVAIMTLFISAQSEGRFFEDTYLWILVGYFSAIRQLEV